MNYRNINDMSREELLELPGVGEVLASRIRNFIRENGRFERLIDIPKIHGISWAGFEELEGLGIRADRDPELDPVSNTPDVDPQEV